jgi:hypothetical protein
LPQMSRPLRFAILVTDTLFIAYWLINALAAVGVFQLPSEMMYRGYDQPNIIAWNWSFLPLDLAFSLCGLSAVAADRRGRRIWLPLALLSLAFTIAAGGMAIAYWTILGEFNPSWFIPNAIIFVWPFLFLPRLIRHFGS